MTFINSLSAQNTNKKFDETFAKEFYKAFKLPEEIKETCKGQLILLIVNIDDKFTPISFKFSDNASIVLKSELQNTTMNMDVSLMSRLLKENNIKSTCLLYPILFVSVNDECSNYDEIANPGQIFSLFDGLVWDEPCLLRATIKISSYGTIHN
nr:hypothetical protein [Pedobacter glucosidilyticus]